MTKQSIKNLAGFVNALDQAPNQLEGKVILSEMLFDALEDLCNELEKDPVWEDTLPSYLQKKLSPVINLFRELQKPYSADYEVCNIGDTILNLNPGEVYEPNKN